MIFKPPPQLGQCSTPAGPHKFTIENRHLMAISVYLVNAAQPRFATVQITRQKRNENQSTGEIEFTFHPFRPKIAEPGEVEGGEVRRDFSVHKDQLGTKSIRSKTCRVFNFYRARDRSFRA